MFVSLPIARGWVILRLRFLRRNGCRHTASNLIPQRCQFHQSRKNLVGVHPRPGNNNRPHVHYDHGDFAGPLTMGGNRNVGGPSICQCCNAECPYRHCAKHIAQHDTPFPKHLTFNPTGWDFYRWCRGSYFRFLSRACRNSRALCRLISSWLSIESGHDWYTP